MTQQELVNSYNKQMQQMQQQLASGDLNALVESAELLVTWLKVKVKELEK